MLAGFLSNTPIKKAYPNLVWVWGFFFPSYAFRGWHEELRIYKTNLDTFC